MSTGLVLGVLTFLGFFLLFRRFPNWLKKTIHKYRLSADLLCTVGTYFMLSSISGSVAAAIGAAVSGILCSLSLNFINKNANV